MHSPLSYRLINCLAVGLFCLLPGFSAHSQQATRVIDRPYTLGNYEQELQVNSGLVFEKERNTLSTGTTSHELNVRLRTKLSKNSSLIWSPLPLGIQRRFKPSEGAEAGVSWNFGFYQDFKLGFLPQFEGYLRTRADDNLAWVHRVQYSVFIPLNGSAEVGAVTYQFGSLQQLRDDFALTTTIAVAVNDFELRSILVNKEGIHFDREVAKIVFPIGLKAEWNATNDFTAGLDYSFRGLGIHQKYHIHRALLTLAYSW